MRIIEPSAEILPEIIDPLKAIERAARLCYKSEDKITEDSAKNLVQRLIKSGHGSMLEHGTIYLTINADANDDEYEYINKLEAVTFFIKNPFSIVNRNKNEFYITTNYRVVVEQYKNILDLGRFIVEPTPNHDKRYSVKFICDRSISHELVRSRGMSMAMESQRYINYSKGKFGHSITVIRPEWVTEPYEGPAISWYKAMVQAEESYFSLIDAGMKPEQARKVLPNSTKTELIFTGFKKDWKWFLSLRADGEFGKPDSDMLRITIPLKEQFEKVWK